MLLLLPLHYLGPANSEGGGCCVAAVSRAFILPLSPSAPFVNLAADVLGQSSELLEAYLQAAADAAARDGDDASFATALSQTVLALVIFSFLPTPKHKLTTSFLNRHVILHWKTPFAAPRVPPPPLFPSHMHAPQTS